MSDEPRRPKLAPILIGGVVVLAAGWLAARARLPEWRAPAVRSALFFRQQTASALNRAELAATNAPPVLRLTTAELPPNQVAADVIDPAWRRLGPAGSDWLTDHGRGLLVESVTQASWPSGESGRARLALAGDGCPVTASWTTGDLNRVRVPDPRSAQSASFAAVTACREATLGEAEHLERLSMRFVLRPVVGTDPPEYVKVIGEPSEGVLIAHRKLGDVAAARQRIEAFTLAGILWERAGPLVPKALLAIGVLALFLVQLHRRQIGFADGVLLAALASVASLEDLRPLAGGGLDLVNSLLRLLTHAAVVLVLWSVAESWLRGATPGFTTSLDALRVGRLGPRGGSALAAGWGYGAGVAGTLLLAAALAASVSGLAPTGSSVALPAFSCANNPIGRGVAWAASVVLAELVARRLFRRRFGAILALPIAAPLLAPALPLHPYLYALTIAAALAAILLVCLRRHGLTALLAAAIVAGALPTALLAAQQLAWLPATGAGVALVALVPLVAGVVGRRRSAAAERGGRLRPAFVLRQEDEQRVRHEMDLLARMQLGLLPETPPRLPGWEIAARSLLANEAGGDLYDFFQTPDARLWIAAGDVSGHGYSCAIAQAMTKAGLASLVEPGRSPSEVLQRLDRVLRSSGAARTFTSLALLRLDPQSGEGVLANAGHPYPMLLSGGAVRELDLAALPLGQGPPREYVERPVALAPGDVLVFCSDGLFEGVDDQDRAYGTDRAAATLAQQTDRSAEQVIDALLADWRHHLAGRALEDDTTLVVLRRLPAG